MAVVVCNVIFYDCTLFKKITHFFEIFKISNYPIFEKYHNSYNIRAVFINYEILQSSTDTKMNSLSIIRHFPLYSNGDGLHFFDIL